MSGAVRRAVAVLIIIPLALAAANWFFTRTQVGQLNQQARVQAATIAQLQKQQRAGCGFASLLGSLPVADSPKPGKTGVTLIADSRDWWRQLGCPGALPAPPGFDKWAAYYRLPSSLRR